MIINNCSAPQSTNLNNYKKNNVSFGQIKPDHLFIKMDGFSKNESWAKKMIEVIDNQKNNFKTTLLSKIVDNVALEYLKLFRQHPEFERTLSNKIYHIREGAIDWFGAKRDVQFCTKVDGRYESYKPRIDKFFNNKPLGYEHHFYTNIDGEKIPLSFIEKGKWAYFWVTPKDGKDTKTVMTHVDKLQKELLQLGKATDENSLDPINKKVAEIHWHLVQDAPYLRGTAGISDVTTKTIYEALGVQVSPWKKGLAPDLEALVTPLDDFVEKYPKMFEKMPQVM